MTIHSMTAQFGCLSGETLTLGDHMNLIYAPNEGGKSTWCAFLCAMLYGIGNEAESVKPWNGAPLEGSLECTHEEKRIRLRRTSKNGAPMGVFSAVYVHGGGSVPGMTGENAGELLTGVGREVFERSVFIRQSQLYVDESRQLAKRIEALVSAGGERSAAEVRERLQKQRAEKSGEVTASERELQTREARLEQLLALHREELLLRQEVNTARDELRQTQAEEEGGAPEAAGDAEWDAAEEELRAARLRLENMEEDDKRLEDEAIEELEAEITLRERDIRARGRTLFGFCFLALVLAVAFMASSLVHLEEVQPAMLAAAIGFAGLVVLLGAAVRARLDLRDYREIDLLTDELEERNTLLDTWDLEWEVALAREKSAWQAVELAAYRRGMPLKPAEWIEDERALARSEAELALLTGRLRELGDPAVLEAELLALRTRHEKLVLEEKAMETALLALREAERELRARFSPALNEQAGRYFAHLTGGAYEKLNLERNFEAMAQQKGGQTMYGAGVLSQGTLDQLYLSVRLAIGDLLLPRKNACPLILDDALISFDEDRCLLALRLFKYASEHRQIILLSTHKREDQLLGEDTKVLRQQLARNA